MKSRMLSLFVGIVIGALLVIGYNFYQRTFAAQSNPRNSMTGERRGRFNGQRSGNFQGTGNFGSGGRQRFGSGDMMSGDFRRGDFNRKPISSGSIEQP